MAVGILIGALAFCDMANAGDEGHWLPVDLVSTLPGPWDLATQAIDIVPHDTLVVTTTVAQSPGGDPVRGTRVYVVRPSVVGMYVEHAPLGTSSSGSWHKLEAFFGHPGAPWGELHLLTTWTPDGAVVLVGFTVDDVGVLYASACLRVDVVREASAPETIYRACTSPRKVDLPGAHALQGALSPRL